MKTEPTEAKQMIENSWLLSRTTINFKNDVIKAINIAFQEGQSSPKIKQLEWKYDDKFFIWEAGSVFGKYSFVDNSLIVNKKLFFRGKVIAIVLTIDEVKAAAQRDFEKRIKECLE